MKERIHTIHTIALTQRSDLVLRAACQAARIKLDSGPKLD